MVSSKNKPDQSVYRLAESLCYEDDPLKKIKEYICASEINEADLLVAFAKQLNKNGFVRKSKFFYERALEIIPGDLNLLRNFTNVLNLCGDLEDAIRHGKRVMEHPDANREDHFNLAELLLKYKLINEAIEVYQKLTLSHPKLPELKIKIGNVYKSLGNFEKAKSFYQEAIFLNPDHAWALTSDLGIDKPLSTDDKRVVKIKSLLNQSHLRPEKKVTLEFGLGKAYDYLENYQEAMEHFNSANLLRRKQLPAYDHENFLITINEHITAFDDKLLEKSTAVTNDTSPIFIIGMPRSGTTLVEQILSAHSSINGAGELTDMNFLVSQLKRQAKFKGCSLNEYLISLDSEQFNGLGEEYLQAVYNRLNDKQRFTDKLPHNFLHVGFILSVLPKAKIIHCKRHPVDTCLSIFKNNFATYHNYAYDLKDIAEHYQACDAMMDHWNNLLEDSIYELEYESLIKSPQREIEKLLKHCDLETENACFNFQNNPRMVSTISMTQVREPIHNRSIGLWKKYGQDLSVLMEVWNQNKRLRFNQDQL